MAFMVTNFRGMISRALAPVAMAMAVLLLAAGSASAAQPLPWQLGLQPPAGSIATQNARLVVNAVPSWIASMEVAKR